MLKLTVRVTRGDVCPASRAVAEPEEALDKHQLSSLWPL